MRKYIDEGDVVTELAFTDWDDDKIVAIKGDNCLELVVDDNPEWEFKVIPKDINKMIALLQEAKKEFYPDVQQTKTL